MIVEEKKEKDLVVDVYWVRKEDFYIYLLLFAFWGGLGLCVRHFINRYHLFVA